MKRMFTNYAGKERYDENQSFWAWEVNKKEFAESELELEVEEGDYEIDDIGLYIVDSKSEVKWIK